MWFINEDNAQDVKAFLLATVVMVVWVEGCKWLAHHQLLTRPLRRKLVHVFSGPIFLLTWPLFSSSGCTWAALVPVVMTLKFALIGLGLLEDKDTVETLSRQGNREDILRGPLFYGIVFVLSTYFFFKEVRGVIGLMCLCFGDGSAEIFGRIYGEKRKLSWSKLKSWPGLVAFLVASSICSLVMISLLNNIDAAGFEIIPMNQTIPRVLFASVCAAFVESVSFSDIDNMTVFAGAVIADICLCSVMSTHYTAS
jgi:dolichol kinase